MSEDVLPYGAQRAAPGARTDRLRELMATLGFSQRQTADALEVDQRTVRYWAAANPEPPLMAVLALEHLVALAGSKGARVDVAAGSMSGPSEARRVVHKEWRNEDDGVITPEMVADAFATGGRDAVDALLARSSDGEGVERAGLGQLPRGNR